MSDTFTIIGRCERTDMLGIGMATSSICVAAHCPFAKANIGAVSIQAYSDPRLGPLAIKLLEMGYSAPKVLAELKASDPHIEHRQIGVVDKDGNSAAYTGSKNADWSGHITGKNYIAMGNYLAGEMVTRAIAESFEASAGESLEERLMRAIEAGRDAGGQMDGLLYSSSILVYDRAVFPRVDLRVDHHKKPVNELRRILDTYKPLIPYYMERVSDPERYGFFTRWLVKHGTKEDLKRYFGSKLGTKEALKKYYSKLDK